MDAMGQSYLDIQAMPASLRGRVTHAKAVLEQRAANRRNAAAKSPRGPRSRR